MEANENFVITISNPQSASIATATASGIIKNDDESLSIFTEDTNKAEGNSGSTFYNFSVVRSGDISAASSVSYKVTSTGSNPADATDFFDNVLPSGTVSFASGESKKTITIDVSGDTNIEDNESFSVLLFNPIATSINIKTANTIILDDDNKPENDTEDDAAGLTPGGSGGLLFGLLLPLLFMRRKR